MQLLLLGSTTLIRTNTMYAARSDPKQACDPQATLGQPWQLGELRVILPPGRAPAITSCPVPTAPAGPCRP